MKKCAIVGFAPSTRAKAPYDNSDFEVWVLNEYYTALPQANNITRWFEIHQRDTVLESKRSPDYIQHLKDSKIPIYMVQKYDDIPMSIPYPLDEIRRKLKTDYFTNSISYMVAMAIVDGYEEIHLYGVDMAQEEEYSRERPSVEYFIGYAVSKGIKVYIPPESDICKVPYFYGFEEASAHKICTTIDPKKADLDLRINADDTQVDEMLEQIDFQLKKYILEYADKDKLDPVVSGILGKLWEYSQSLRGFKKERLFLAGANDMCGHLRKVLCPYD
jgi:hypothetical protein